jgi:hypothetical protein
MNKINKIRKNREHTSKRDNETRVLREKKILGEYKAHI